MNKPRNHNHRPALTPKQRDGIVRMKLNNERSAVIRDALDVSEGEINRVWAEHRAAHPTVKPVDQKRPNKK